MKIVISGAATPEEVPGIETIADDADLVFAPDRERLAEVLPDAEILLGWNFANRDVPGLWDRVRDLKWIHWCGASVEAVLCPGLVASDIQLTNARGIFDLVMAEYILGYMLAEAKRFEQSREIQRQRVWKAGLTGQLAGTRAAIFGVGSIGRETARLLKANGVEVIGIGRSGREDDPDFGTVYGPLRKLDAASEADWVIGLMPLTPETEDYFTAEFFSAMKPGARFTNLGSGKSVDEAALVEHLEAGRIAGAMLDVFRQEPLPSDSPLWTAPNMFISPHRSSYYEQYPEDMARQFLDLYADYRVGRPFEHMVDKRLGFVPSAA